MSEVGRALIVDDDEDIRKILRRVLPSAGVEVAGEVASGEAALEWLESERVDVVVLDIQMPGLGGVETTRRIKQSSPDVMVFGFTGWGSADREEMLTAGAVGVFEKTKLPALIEAIRELQDA